MKEKYSITGMSCSSCANHVNRAVSQLSGVLSCEVNLLLNQMIVDKNESLSAETIIQTVNDAGYGASLYNPLAKLDDKEIKDRKKRLIISIVLMVLLSYLAMAEMFGLPQFAALSKMRSPVIHCMAQLTLCLSIYFINVKRLLAGLKALAKGKPTMDSLIGLGCVSSFIYSLYTTICIIANADAQTGILYCETGAMVLVFSSIGKYLESLSKVKTTAAISNLISITPQNAILINDGKNVRIKVDDIQIGDLLLIKPGAKIPTDGIVVEGHSYNDQSVLTGESVPVFKNKGDALISGALNLNGVLKMKANRRFGDSTFSKIITLVEEAANSKAPISRLADRISLYFVPGVIILSILTGLIWICVSDDFNTAFAHTISVLVVSCPCALGLATPTAIMVCSGKAAKMGIIFKNASVIEETAAIDTLVFDKTNTITAGKMTVTDINQYHPCDKLKTILYALERNSEHPLAGAVIAYCKDEADPQFDLECDYRVGQGIVAIKDKKRYALGSQKLMSELDVKISEYDDVEPSDTKLYFSQDDQLIALIFISDPLKRNVKETLSALNHYQTVMLSGDNRATADAIAKQCGIKQVFGDVMPDGKQQIIQSLQSQNKKVAMIGDGINDSIALTQANVGIAINNATDIAIESSDVVLMNDEISNLVNIFNLSKYTFRIIKQNLYWALGYNCLLIPLAAGLFSLWGISLNPMISSACMSLSSITVVTNALRINRYQPFVITKVSCEFEKTYTLEIDHMMCEHCQRAVENALLNLNIVATTDLPSSSCTFTTNVEPDTEAIKEELQKAGYTVTAIH